MILKEFHVVYEKNGTLADAKMGIIIKCEIVKSVIEPERTEEIVVAEGNNNINTSK
jgi:hypothetical protein